MMDTQRRFLGMMLGLMALFAIWFAPSWAFCQDDKNYPGVAPGDTLTNHFHAYMEEMRKDPDALQCLVWQYQVLTMHPPETHAHSNYFEPCWKRHLANKARPGYHELQDPPPESMMRVENWNTIPRYNAETKRLFNIFDRPDPLPAPAAPVHNPTLREQMADPGYADVEALEAENCITNLQLTGRCGNSNTPSRKASTAQVAEPSRASRVAAHKQAPPAVARPAARKPQAPVAALAAAQAVTALVSTDSSPGLPGWQIVSKTAEKLTVRALAGADLRTLRRVLGGNYQLDDTMALARHSEFRDFDIGYRSDGKTMYEPLHDASVIVWDPARHNPREALKRDLKGPVDSDFLASAKGPIYLVPQIGQTIVVMGKGVEAPPPPKALAAPDSVAVQDIPPAAGASAPAAPTPPPADSVPIALAANTIPDIGAAGSAEVLLPASDVPVAAAASNAQPVAGVHSAPASGDDGIREANDAVHPQNAGRIDPNIRRSARNRQKPPMLMQYCRSHPTEGVCHSLNLSLEEKTDEAPPTPGAKSKDGSHGVTGPPN